MIKRSTQRHVGRYDERMLQVEPPHLPDRPRRRVRRRPGLGRLLLVALIWAVAAAVVLATAAVTRIGPVLIQINERHGVHAFDLLVGTAMFCLALLVTAWIVRPHPGRYRPDAARAGGAPGVQ